jgi:AraC family ethanolamine operon transcriptional activator
MAQTIGGARLKQLAEIGGLYRSYAHGCVDTNIPGWSLSCVQTSAGKLTGGARELHVPGLQVLEEHYCNVAINHYGVAAPESIGFVVPLRVQGEGMFDGKPWHAGTICMWNTNREFNALAPPADIICVMLNRALLLEHIAQTEHIDLEPALLHASIVFCPQVVSTTRLAERLTLLIGASFGKSSDMTAPCVQQAIRQEVLETLAPVVVEQLDEKRNHHAPHRHLIHVRRAREFALEHPDTPLQVQDLCRELRISRRVLQDSFRAVLGVSPLWYLRTLRLDGARRALLAGCPVGQVVEQWGFWHWSRFSHDYRQLFGELPSATLKRGITSKCVQS